ncbi:MAG: hypothetical protein IPI54_02000 [Chitinophagaceae bacterium]|nr:hypothetical protein [Chitinophagaceae bacterium]
MRYWNNDGLEAIEKKYATGDFRGFKRDWIGNNNLVYGLDVLHDVGMVFMAAGLSGIRKTFILTGSGLIGMI